jgi:hypothetical protein
MGTVTGHHQAPPQSRPPLASVPAPGAPQPMDPAVALQSAVLQMLHAQRAALAELPGAVHAAASGAGLGRCAFCYLERADWEADHAGEIQAAREQHAAALTALARLGAEARVQAQDAGLPAPPDLMAFLPEALRPGGEQGMPPVNPAAAILAGTGHCPQHLAAAAPGTRQQRAQQARQAQAGQPGARQFLIALSGDVHAAARDARGSLPVR